MRKPTVFLLTSLTLLLQTTLCLADASDDPSPPFLVEDAKPLPQSTKAKASSNAFQAFTGRVVKSKVRVRLQPRLDSPIVKELNKGEMFIVVDEADDFYAIKPPADTKGYVFRTYILDGVVEGSRVNVRLEPDVDAPVLAQLNGGERVTGTVSALNNKWLEIAPPASSRFYIAKDFVEKLGNASELAKIERRRDEVNFLLNSTYIESQNEMQKDFPNINLDTIYANYNKVINNYSDFPEQAARARELTTKLQDDYLQKKIPYLEAQAKMGHQQYSEQLKAQQQKLSQLEQQLQRERSGKGGVAISTANQSGINNKMSAWLPAEQQIYQTWAAENNQGTMDDFYADQRQKAIPITGIVELYPRVIKNKPGDYVLMSQANQQPTAFLYSTLINLQDRIGQEVTLYAVPRPNNNFAFPAYFVISIE